jgi:hypothetical protein
MHIANTASTGEVPAQSRCPQAKTFDPGSHFRPGHARGRHLPSSIAAAHQGIYATILNYPERELRYMDAGERGPKAPTLGHLGRRVTNSHVINHDVDHRYAVAALDGANLR